MKYDTWSLRKIGEHAGNILAELDKKTPYFVEEKFINSCEELIKYYLKISERTVGDILKDE